MTLVEHKSQFGSATVAVYWSPHGEVFRDLHGSDIHLTLSQMNWMRDRAAE
jgi:hypothetical protein